MRIDGRATVFQWKAFDAVVAVVALLLTSLSAYSQQIKLFSIGKGWLFINQHLYWTNNDGNTWKDITPPYSDQEGIMDVFFLDESHGWATIASNEGSWQGARLAIWKGATWDSVPVNNSYRGVLSPFSVQFTDTKHGWLMLEYPSSQGVEPASPMLSFTDDGGRTWKKLPMAPAYGSFAFLSPRRGLLADGSSPFVFWVTINGARTWTRHALPRPSGIFNAFFPSQAYPWLDFRNRTEGTLRFQLSDPEKDMTVLYTTHDGAKTWTLTSTRPYTDKSFPFAACAAGTKLVTFEQKQGSSSEILVHRENGIFRTTILSDVRNLIPQSCEFADRLHGWFIDFDAGLDLFSTSDGRHFRLITPAAVRRPRVKNP